MSAPSTAPSSSSSAISQKLLAQNEDTIAAIVENLQLGRLDEAMQHYLLLQGNLVALASELDNYPTDDGDAFADLDRFPDSLMRKSCLDDLLPFEERCLPRPPVAPACPECTAHKLSSQECRLRLKHVTPGAHLSESEQQELLRNAQVLLARQRQHLRQDREKRGYKKWTDFEKYTLCLAISNYGILSTAKIAAVFPGRSEKQIRNFISKSLRDERAIPPLDQLISHPPPGYVPPAQLAHLFRPQVPGQLLTTDEALQSAKPDNGRNDFGAMIGLAMGLTLLDLVDIQGDSAAALEGGVTAGATAAAPAAAPPPSAIAPTTVAASAMPAPSVPPPKERMTYKLLQEKARQVTDKRQQAALLLEYYNQVGQWDRRRPTVTSDPVREAPTPPVTLHSTLMIPPPAAPLLPPASAPVAAALLPPPAIPPQRKPPPFARQGLMKLQAQLMQQAQMAPPRAVPLAMHMGMPVPPTGQMLNTSVRSPASSFASSSPPSTLASSAAAAAAAAAAVAPATADRRATSPVFSHAMLPIELSLGAAHSATPTSSTAMQPTTFVSDCSVMKPKEKVVRIRSAEDGDKPKKSRKKKEDDAHKVPETAAATEGTGPSASTGASVGAGAGARGGGGKKRKPRKGKEISDDANCTTSSVMFSPTRERSRSAMPASFLQVVRGEGSMDGSFFNTHGQHQLADLEHDGCLIEDLGDGLSFF